MTDEKARYDVVVVGSGSAGMTTAIVAAKHGLDVLLVEKTEYFGGITALSGGGCWIPNNDLMAKVGLSDSREKAETYINNVIGNYLDRDIMKAFLDNGPPMIRYMLDNSEVLFAPRTPAPDNYTEIEGGMVGGRSLGSVLYDGRKLGSWFKKLRPPIYAFNAPMGMMMGPIELMHYRNATKSRASAWFMAKLFGRYFRDRLSHKRGTRLTMGNALAARLLKSAVDAGVTLWSETPAKRLLRAGGRVTGIVVERNGREIEIAADRGVVLATGGFSQNAEMREKYFPFAADHQSMVPEGNTGDGLNMATAAGAAMGTPNRRNGTWTTVSLWKKRNGTVEKCPHFFDMSKPGCIAVNRSGHRFGNEANLELPIAMHDSGSVPAWLVCDDRFLKTYGLGHVWPGGLRKTMLKRDGYLLEAATIADLARKTGIDEAGLIDTIARNNDFASTGKDRDFGRGDGDLDKTIGDPAHGPNPCLGPIDKGPFYAVQIFPGDVSSVTGLRVDAGAHVIGEDGRAIPGLYACGLDMNSLWAGHGIANGAYHGLNMTFGYIIARELAGQDAKRLDALQSAAA